MSNLGPQQQKDSFAGILQIPNGVTPQLQQVQDGNGVPTGLWLSSAGVNATTADSFTASVNGAAISGVVPRLISDAFGDTISLKDFGATGNGSTNDTAAIALAESSSFTRIYVPQGTYNTTYTSINQLTKIYFGEGQLVINGYATALEASSTTTIQPVPSTDRYQIFSDLTNVPNTYFKSVTSGANPSVLPSIYTNFAEWAQRVGIYDFTAGFNTSASDHALGRSGAFTYVDRLYHGGQGDLVCRNFYGEVYSNRSGATHFLANPALIVENGNLGVSDPAGAGCYLNHSEYLYSDSGNAVACIDRVRNYIRTNAGASLYQVWIHDRPQSNGSQPIDSFYSVAGSGKVGLDFTPATLTSDKAAIALKYDDRIYFGASCTTDPLGAKWYANNLGNTYISGASPNYINLIAGGNLSLQIGTSDIFSTNSNGLTFTSTGILRFAGTGQYSTGSSTANFTATNKPGGTSGAGPSQWLRVSLGGSAYYLPAWSA